ncbi:ABC transporter ATP-binding protein [Candidatus Thorarchaeota archaeon]|nr:MAG: ABC transporter ATP-binding protein [Candidatus Thorarchaeota archaeon]
MSDGYILEVGNLKKYFTIRSGLFSSILFNREPTYIRAVDGIDLKIKRGEIFAIAGESGCGKTTIARLIMGLEVLTDGEIIFDGENISDLTDSEFRPYRRRIQMIFQDPYGSLSNNMTVGDIIAEPLRIHGICESAAEEDELIVQTLEDVGMRPAEDFIDRLPHELSGGQRQRVAVGAALVLQPELLIADEPVSMLDVSMRGQILKLLLDLREKKGISIVIITHNLAVARQISDRIAIAYLGKVMEIGDTKLIIDQPMHAYTKALLSVVPVPELDVSRDRILLTGETPNPINIPEGCRFHTRCPFAENRCSEAEPELVEQSDGRLVACCQCEDD